MTRCPKCDRFCWNDPEGCLFASRERENHPDAQLGDSVPHIRETDIAVFHNKIHVSSAVELSSLRRARAPIEVRVDNKFYTVGYASGDGCNCLIETLRQKLNLIADTAQVRHCLEMAHRQRPTRIKPGDYLELEHHWADVVDLLFRFNEVGFSKVLAANRYSNDEHKSDY